MKGPRGTLLSGVGSPQWWRKDIGWVPRTRPSTSASEKTWSLRQQMSSPDFEKQKSKIYINATPLKQKQNVIYQIHGIIYCPSFIWETIL